MFRAIFAVWRLEFGAERREANSQFRFCRQHGKSGDQHRPQGVLLPVIHEANLVSIRMVFTVSGRELRTDTLGFRARRFL